MRKLLLLIFLIPHVIFCEESISPGLDLPNGNPFINEKTEKSDNTVSQKLFNSVIDIGIPVLWAGLSFGIREGVYKNNYSENWFGTVNGIFTLSFCGGILGMGIPLLLDLFFTKEDLPSAVYMIGMYAGILTGGILAFVSPFYRVFRENPVAYYTAPGLAGIIGTISIISIWIKE